MYIKPSCWLGVHPAFFVKGVRILTRSLKNKRYMSTLPRSGTNYIIALLTSASDIASGGSGEYQYVDEAWVFDIELVYPSVLHNFVEVLKKDGPVSPNFFMFAHHPVQRTNMFDVESMKAVFTVRNIFDQLESWLLHTFEDSSAQDEFIKKGYVGKTIEHFNYWGDFISGPDKVADKNYVCIRYEDMISEPLNNLRRIVRLWNLDIEESALSAAVELCGREKMMSKIPSNLIDSNKRVVVRDDRGKLF
ncbi:MAG: sulfotransferase domain-containing protein, partial [Desulfobacteraceae bacterium]|nr:sulfotransferase domain-containing protein [Desulfobacteraceae bacterium]